MKIEQFDESYDEANALLEARGIARYHRADALLVAAALGRAETGKRVIDTVVTFDRENGYTVTDYKEE